MSRPVHHKNHLAAIHIAHKALGLSKDDALALKMSVTGVASAGDMTEQQRKRYLAHLAGLQSTMAVARGENPEALRKRQACLAIDCAPLAGKLKTRPPSFTDQLAELNVPPASRGWFHGL